MKLGLLSCDVESCLKCENLEITNIQYIAIIYKNHFKNRIQKYYNVNTQNTIHSIRHNFLYFSSFVGGHLVLNSASDIHEIFEFGSVQLESNSNKIITLLSLTRINYVKARYLLSVGQCLAARQRTTRKRCSTMEVLDLGVPQLLVG